MTDQTPKKARKNRAFFLISSALIASFFLYFRLPACSLPKALADETIPAFCGSYVGYAYIYNQTGGRTKTDIRLNIKKGDNESFILEMHMLEDKIARFSRLKAKNPYLLTVDEKVGTDQAGKAVAKGRVVTQKLAVSGSISIYPPGEKENDGPVRTIKFLAEKLSDNTHL